MKRRKRKLYFNPVPLMGAIFLAGIEFICTAAIRNLWLDEYHILDQIGVTLILGVVMLVLAVVGLGLLWITFVDEP